MTHTARNGNLEPVNQLLANEMDWMSEAGCQDYPHEWWFDPDDPDATAAAITVCRTECKVRSQCLLYSLMHAEVGVWGGYSQANRRNLSRAEIKAETQKDPVRDQTPAKVRQRA